MFLDLKMIILFLLIYISEEKFEAHMELLLISEINEDGESKNHYVLIKDFNKFMFGTT